MGTQAAIKTAQSATIALGLRPFIRVFAPFAVTLFRHSGFIRQLCVEHVERQIVAMEGFIVMRLGSVEFAIRIVVDSHSQLLVALVDFLARFRVGILFGLYQVVERR